MLIGFDPQGVDDRIARVFLFVVPIDDPGRVGVAEINDHQQTKRDRRPPGARAGERTAQNQSQQRDGQTEKQYEDAHFSDAELRDGRS